MAEDFKIGDRVTVSEDAWGHQGSTGTVASVFYQSINVDLDYYVKQDEWFHEDKLVKLP